MQDEVIVTPSSQKRVPWNKGKRQAPPCRDGPFFMRPLLRRPVAQHC
jgi:hypothetical protein